MGVEDSVHVHDTMDGSDVMLWLWFMVTSSSRQQQLCGMCSVCYGYGFSTSMNTSNKYE